MIESLHHLPPATGTHATLSERFTDLAPPLTSRQAAIESTRCLNCYEAPATRVCPSARVGWSCTKNRGDH